MPDFSQCRAMGHEWHHQGRQETHDGRVGLQSLCSVCLTTRTKFLGRQGQLYGSRYEYPDGYSQHGEERLQTFEWRTLFVNSLFPEDGKPKRKRKAAA